MLEFSLYELTQIKPNRKGKRGRGGPLIIMLSEEKFDFIGLTSKQKYLLAISLATMDRLLKKTRLQAKGFVERVRLLPDSGI